MKTEKMKQKCQCSDAAASTTNYTRDYMLKIMHWLLKVKAQDFYCSFTYPFKPFIQILQLHKMKRTLKNAAQMRVQKTMKA